MVTEFPRQRLLGSTFSSGDCDPSEPKRWRVSNVVRTHPATPWDATMSSMVLGAVKEVLGSVRGRNRVCGVHYGKGYFVALRKVHSSRETGVSDNRYQCLLSGRRR